MLFRFLQSGDITFDRGALLALISIVIVFLVLLIIIGITSLVFKIMGLFELKKQLSDVENKKNEINEEKKESQALNLDDDDMMAAVLVATIDYRQEVKKDVKLISVKEIK